MFERLDEPDAARVVFDFEGEAVSAFAGETVAAALLAHGATTFRQTPVSGRPRAPYCMIGVCFDCLVEIDGIANRQACRARARDGMRVRRQAGAPDPLADRAP